MHGRGTFPNYETNTMMNSFQDTLFDGEAESAVNRLAATRDAIKDRDLFTRTADAISEGYDPESNLRITSSDLRRWIERYQTEPQPQEHPAHEDHPRRTIEPKRDVHHA